MDEHTQDNIKQIKLDYQEFKIKILDNTKEYEWLIKQLDILKNHHDPVQQYFYFKSVVFPNKLEEKATNFLLKFIKPDIFSLERIIDIDAEDVTKLQYLSTLYGDLLLACELFVTNPYSLTSFNHSFNDNNDTYNLHLNRADLSNFVVNFTLNTKTDFVLNQTMHWVEDIRRTQTAPGEDVINFLQTMLTELEELQKENI